MADDPADKGGNDPTQAFNSRLTKMNGDAMALATQLFDENFRLREQKRTLVTEADELKKKLPADGSVVLSADKAKDYEAYQSLGKADELKTRLDAHTTLETEVASLKKKEVLRSVAELHGFKVSVLEDRDTAAGGLEYVKKQDAQKREVYYVKEGDKETPVNEFAETNWADYMPSLKAEQAPPLQPTRTGHAADPRPVSPNGSAAYDHSRKAMEGSGKYGM